MMASLWPVLSVSLKVAIIATAVVMSASVMFAVALIKTRSRILRMIEFAIYVPMALPPVALGYGLLLLFGRTSFLGRALHELFGIDVSFTMLGAIVAACATSLGLGVRSVRMALERVDRGQINMARLIGATDAQIAWHVYVPQCYQAILGGAVLVFIRALSEFGATMVLAGNTLGETRTLALAIWIGMETPGQEHQCLLFVLLAVLISLFAILSAELLLRRSRHHKFFGDV
jgi:molybdate transport system permease protein